MSLFDLLAIPLAFLLCRALTLLVRKRAIARGVLDVPNARSSHSIPTPRGGGLAIVVTIAVATIYFWWRGQLSAALLWGVLVGGSAVAGVGYLDDAYDLSARSRFAVHVCASAVAVFLLGGLTLARTVLPVVPPVVGVIVLILAMCWSINLFNFMDGIDGIAGSEFGFVVAGAALLYSVFHGLDGTALYLYVCAAAAAGFLAVNWAPARIFMGDVGSGFLGYVIALLALYFAAAEKLSLWTWVVLYVIFVADASVTLLRRAWSGAKWFEAHRSHVYQRLSRRWASHARVCQALWSANVLLLLPAAYCAMRWPEIGFWMAVGAVILFGSLFFWMGAGKKESE